MINRLAMLVTTVRNMTSLNLKDLKMTVSLNSNRLLHNSGVVLIIFIVYGGAMLMQC